MVDVRKMGETDLDTVARIHEETFNATGDNWTSDIANEYVVDKFKGGGNFVAEVDGKIVGYVLSEIMIDEAGKELFVHAIATLPETQKQGVGKKLFDVAVENGKANGCKVLGLLANPNYQSYKWYENMGFKNTGWVQMGKIID